MSEYMSIKRYNKRDCNFAVSRFGDSTENRTRVTAVKGRCLNRLTMEPEKPATSYFPRQLPTKYHRR